MSTLKLVGSLSIGTVLFIAVWINTSQDEVVSGNELATHSSTTLQNRLQTQESSEASNTISQTANMPSPKDVESSEIISAQVEDALMQFDEISKYPPTSQPILNEAHVNSFMNTSLPQASLPFPFDDLETPIQVSIELESKHFFFWRSNKGKSKYQ